MIVEEAAKEPSLVAIPPIISVDDHVVEPPDLWLERLPTKYRDRCPRVLRGRATFGFKGGSGYYTCGGSEGRVADIWVYDDLMYPLPRLSAAVGFDELGNEPATFDELRPGAYLQEDRLLDMSINGVEASLCFPNVLPRFCGQAFLERSDKTLALLCLRAYNDWVLDEWTAGPGRGRLLPVTIVPLWDPKLAAMEVERCANKGGHAISFSENPAQLGLPSMHDDRRWWDPLLAKCAETQTVINMHIGSSSTMATTSSDAPHMLSSTLTFYGSMGSMLDWILSGVFVRFPTLKIAYSEGQAGWVPYVLERVDKLWAERSNNSFGSIVPDPPSSYISGRVWFCLFDDEVALRNRGSIGMSQLCFEVDYPHADSTFPHTLATAQRLATEASLNQSEANRLFRRNAVELLDLEVRYGIEPE
jgi:predicted TIM-barrel fold metal-dependent hydrolase